MANRNIPKVGDKVDVKNNFHDGFLMDIPFILVDVNGKPENEKCYGTGIVKKVKYGRKKNKGMITFTISSVSK